MKLNRWIISILLVLCAGNSWSQEWRDSLRQARELYRNSKYNEALKYYKSAERLAPNSVDLSEEKGQSAYRAGQYPEAEQAFQRAAQHQTDKKRKVTAYNNLGSTRMKQQNYTGAEESFKDALRLDPSSEKARQGLAEAKRQRKKKEEQQQNQQQDENNKNEAENQQKQNGNQNQPQQQKDDQQQKPADSDQQSGKDGEQKLADKQTERKLDDLMRQESATKKRLDGSKGNSNGKSAKKDW